MHLTKSQLSVIYCRARGPEHLPALRWKSDSDSVNHLEPLDRGLESDLGTPSIPQIWSDDKATLMYN